MKNSLSSTLLPFVLVIILLGVSTNQLLAQGSSPQEEMTVGAEVKPAIPTTSILFDQKAYDFGSIVDGDIVTTIFTFTNTGTESLVLTDAKGSCGCTVPSRPFGPIQPGETASITVQFNSKNKIGQRNQKVTITANTEPAISYLYLTGMVEAKETGKEEELAEVTTEVPRVPKECFAIYPNPTSELLKLSTLPEQEGKMLEVAIYSQDGQLMARRETVVVGSAIEFNVSHYPAGTYFARVKVGDELPQSQCFVVVD